MGRRFWKMSGSGNDFVLFDGRVPIGDEASLERPEAIEALCARGTGVGADGVVIVATASLPGATVAMRYYNSDGSRGAFCGNATLCVSSLASELGLAPGGKLVIETDSGLVPAVMTNGRPGIELAAVTDVRPSVDLPMLPGERRLGFALVGVPHLVVLCDDVDSVDIDVRGRELRHSSVHAGGANANFVSARAGVWSMRTFERGVEGETLACGSGAIAIAILLAAWKENGDSTSLITRSGLPLTVQLRALGGGWMPTLAGQGRIVFTGELPEVAG